MVQRIKIKTNRHEINFLKEMTSNDGFRNAETCHLINYIVGLCVTVQLRNAYWFITEWGFIT